MNNIRYIVQMTTNSLESEFDTFLEMIKICLIGILTIGYIQEYATRIYGILL